MITNVLLFAIAVFLFHLAYWLIYASLYMFAYREFHCAAWAFMIAVGAIWVGAELIVRIR